MAQSATVTTTFNWRYARYAVLGAFFLNGALFANWVSRIPQIQDQYALTEGTLGLLLMGIAVGVIVGLVFVGNLIARYSSRRITWTMAILYCAIFPTLPLMPNPIFLWIALFFFGAIMSAMDVAMNAQAVEVEYHSGRNLMSSFHAAWSVGGVAGAVMGATAVSMALEPPTHFAFVAIFFFILAIIIRQWLVPQDRPVEDVGSALRLPRRELLPFGIIAFCAAIGEGTVADWSSVYMTRVVASEATVAALAFGTFSLMMTIGRLTGDWLAGRFKAYRLVRWGGALAFMGMMLIIFIPEDVTALIGFALIGAGLAVTVPLTFSAAGRLPNIPAGTGIAGVATIGYLGFLVGPPVIGLIAEALSLQVAFGLVALLVGSLFFNAHTLQSNVKA